MIVICEFPSWCHRLTGLTFMYESMRTCVCVLFCRAILRKSQRRWTYRMYWYFSLFSEAVRKTSVLLSIIFNLLNINFRLLQSLLVLHGARTEKQGQPLAVVYHHVILQAQVADGGTKWLDVHSEWDPRTEPWGTLYFKEAREYVVPTTTTDWVQSVS